MSVTTAPSPAVATKDTVPLWLAVAVTVLVSVPFTLWLGGWNLAVWVSFVVWAEYFALGARPAAIKVIAPSFAYSAALTGVTLAAVPLLDFLPSIRTDGDLAVAVALFVGVGLMVWSMRWFPVLQQGTLPFFNGVSMVLAVYFTGSFPAIASGSAAALWAGAWTIVLGAFGVLLAVFNVWLTFPRPVAVAPAAA